jgi:peptide/nickel transport system ATP-binding protein
VMYAGRVVEQGTPATLFSAAAHPYTQALMAAVPGADLARVRPRSPSTRPAVRVLTEGPAAQGCAFAPRCPHRVARCATELPLLRPLASDHLAACHVAHAAMSNAEGEPA